MRKLFVVLVLAFGCVLSSVTTSQAQVLLQKDGIEYYLNLVGNEDDGYSQSYFSVVAIYPEVEPEDLDLENGLCMTTHICHTIRNCRLLTTFIQICLQ